MHIQTRNLIHVAVVSSVIRKRLVMSPNTGMAFRFFITALTETITEHKIKNADKTLENS
ncbi:MAG TPA: hypothetical protein P5265_10135 [Bacteroidia bacterium]|nr:hypothetical protein [Bacteroidia bacterium]